MSQPEKHPPRLYRLYWAPEGRAIADVLATSPQEAVKKSPMPYKEYLGEVYACQDTRDPCNQLS